MTIPLVPSDPRVCTLLPREESGDESQRSDYPDTTTAATYKHVQVWANTKQYIGISSGDTRAIITKVHRNKTARDHVDTEASSRSTPYPYLGLLRHLYPVT
jgi:hypothetical protein